MSIHNFPRNGRRPTTVCGLGKHTRGSHMKRFLIGLAMAGLLLSAPAFAQNNDQDTKDKPAATTSDTNVKVNGDAGRLQNDRTKQNNVKASSETREHRGDRGRMSTTTRTTVGVHV